DDACAIPKFFCRPKPGQGRTETLAPQARANSTVLSRLSASTTTNSSTHRTDLKQSWILASSFLVITTQATVGRPEALVMTAFHRSAMLWPVETAGGTDRRHNRDSPNAGATPWLDPAPGPFFSQVSPRAEQAADRRMQWKTPPVYTTIRLVPPGSTSGRSSIVHGCRQTVPVYS